MLNVVIFGAPGSGKGTQSELIIKEYGLDHISTGDVLRGEMKAETELGKIAKDYIEKGQLVPDELIVDMLANVLDSKKPAKGVIFDGFPRTIPQAKALKKMLNERGTDVSVMLNLQVEEEELIKRLLERGKVSGRSDDNLETIKSRLDVYHTQTAPLADYYVGEGKHVAIKGMGTIEEIFGRIKEAVNNVVSDGVTVTYQSGRKDTIETAVARSVRTGVAQATGDISLKRMEEMDWDLVLVSAHMGARTGDGGENPGNHAWWQGKIYSRSGKSKKFPPFSLTGYGTASGLSGINCRHSFGASDGEFNPYAELSAQDKADKGKQYEKEQRQRTYERRIRKAKREVLGMQTAVDNCKDEQTRFALQQDLDRKSYLLQKQNAAYKDYCKQNDLRELQDRLMIAKWSRQNAAKARGAAKRYKTAKGID